MFERYTESARRAVFRARYEASFASTHEISIVDLLRGVVCESKPMGQGIEWMRTNMDRLSGVLWPAVNERKLTHSLLEEIKLSDDAKRALACAAVAGEGNSRGTIDASTLLLGILAFQNESSLLLAQLGLTPEAAREDVRRLHEKYPPRLVNWFAVIKGILRRNSVLLQILIFLLVVLCGVALVNWINR